MKKATSYNWSAMIDELLTSCTPAAICDAMQMQCSNGVLRHYRLGVQPLYWRGELLLTFYEATTGKHRSEAPTCEIRRGHRVDRRLTLGPKLQSLPQWPPSPPLSVRPLKAGGRAVNSVADSCPFGISADEAGGACSWGQFLDDFSDAWPRWFKAPPTAPQWEMAKRDWLSGKTGVSAAHGAHMRVKPIKRKRVAA